MQNSSSLVEVSFSDFPCVAPWAALRWTLWALSGHVVALRHGFEPHQQRGCVSKKSTASQTLARGPFVGHAAAEHMFKGPFIFLHVFHIVFFISPNEHF